MISHSLSTSLARSLAAAVVTGAALGGCAMMKVKAGGCGACGAR